VLRLKEVILTCFTFLILILTKLQAEIMDLPIIFVESSGIKEKELDDLKDAIIEAKR